MTPDTLLRMKDVVQRVGLCDARIYELIKAGEFPQPTYIGAAARYSANEVALWVQERLDTRPEHTRWSWKAKEEVRTA